ncbi:MAG: histidine kinase, partial [Methanoregulaceae archaeon]
MAGKFIRGELSVFAYDMNRITLVLPYQQVLIGTARRSLSDSNGVAFIRCLTD